MGECCRRDERRGYYHPDLIPPNSAHSLPAMLKDFNPANFLDRADIKRTDPFTQYAIVASDEAIKDSGFDFSKWIRLMWE